jgi:hypothetical protein
MLHGHQWHPQHKTECYGNDTALLVNQYWDILGGPVLSHGKSTRNRRCLVCRSGKHSMFVIGSLGHTMLMLRVRQLAWSGNILLGMVTMHSGHIAESVNRLFYPDLCDSQTSIGGRVTFSCHFSQICENLPFFRKNAKNAKKVKKTRKNTNSLQRFTECKKGGPKCAFR